MGVRLRRPSGRARPRRCAALGLALCISAVPWRPAAADNLPMKLISPDVKTVQALHSSFDLKIQTEAGADCVASISTPFKRNIALDKQTADKDGYVVWSVDTGGAAGSRNVSVTCNHDGKKGSLAFTYQQ